MDLISRKAAIEALGERPKNWTDSPEEIEAIQAYDNAIDDLKSISSVPAVPLDKLCEWLSESSIIIPCTSCANFVNEYCTAIGDHSIPCPKSADDWRKAITKWMEEQDAAY